MRRTIALCVVIVAVVTAIVTVGCLAQNNPSSPSPTSDQAPRPKVLAGPTLAAMIGGSLNSTLFHHWYVEDDQGKMVDAVGGGESSCAFYVSVLLQSVGLCDGVYPHMDRLVEGMERCGWKELKENQDDTDVMVVIWGKEYGNRHLGFAFAGSSMAISHSSFEGCPRRHSLILRDGREIARRWTHPELVDLEESLKLHGVL